MQKSLELCRMILDDLIATGWVLDGAARAYDPSDPECFVSYDPNTFDLTFSPKVADMLRDRLQKIEQRLG